MRRVRNWGGSGGFKRHYTLSLEVFGRLCWLRQAQARAKAPEESARHQTLSLEGSVGCGAREKVPELWGGSGRV